MTTLEENETLKRFARMVLLDSIDPYEAAVKSGLMCSKVKYYLNEPIYAMDFMVDIVEDIEEYDWLKDFYKALKDE